MDVRDRRAGCRARAWRAASAYGAARIWRIAREAGWHGTGALAALHLLRLFDDGLMKAWPVQPLDWAGVKPLELALRKTQAN